MVSVPAANSTGTSAWADDVSNQLNQAHAYMVLTNPNASTPGAGTATWVTMGNITVPTWATKARVSLTMTGISSSTASATSADIAVKIGSSTGAFHRIGNPASTTNRQGAALNDLLTSVPTGSQSVTVQATFVGTGAVWQAPSTACSFDLNIDWMQ